MSRAICKCPKGYGDVVFMNVSKVKKTVEVYTQTVIPTCPISGAACCLRCKMERYSD